MTAYATTTDLSTLGIAAGALTNVSVPAQQAALDAACALADSYLGAKFRLPITAWGKDVTLNVCKLAAFEALRIRGFAPEGIDQSIRDGWSDAIRWFEKIAAGDVTPVVTDSSAAGSVGGPFTLSPSLAQNDDGSTSVIVGTPSPRGW